METLPPLSYRRLATEGEGWWYVNDQLRPLCRVLGYDDNTLDEVEEVLPLPTEHPLRGLNTLNRGVFAKVAIKAGANFGCFHHGCLIALADEDVPGTEYVFRHPFLRLVIHGNPFGVCSGPIANDPRGVPSLLVNVCSVPITHYNESGNVDIVTVVRVNDV